MQADGSDMHRSALGVVCWVADMLVIQRDPGVFYHGDAVISFNNILWTVEIEQSLLLKRLFVP